MTHFNVHPQIGQSFICFNRSSPHQLYEKQPSMDLSKSHRIKYELEVELFFNQNEKFCNFWLFCVFDHEYFVDRDPEIRIYNWLCFYSEQLQN